MNSRASSARSERALGLCEEVVNTLSADCRMGPLRPSLRLRGSCTMCAMFGFTKVSDHRNLGA